MKKVLVLALAATVVAFVAWSQSVDEQELKSVGERDIVFESYTGTHPVVDTAEEIVAIGRSLALALRAAGSRGDFYGMYSVIRAVDPAETRKLDADIIVFEKTAGVDHIRNVRRIIAGYVQTAFGYTRADAELLAVFVTYYNAVFRGRIDELSARYSGAVMSNITAENAGLALSYREWPGRTRILIPFARAGLLPAGSPQAAAAGAPSGAVSTTELTEKKVIAQLRTEPDKGLDERKAMVDLKEREVEKAKESIAAEEKRIQERKAEVAKREEAVKAGTVAPVSTPTPSTPATTRPAGTTAAQPSKETPAAAAQPSAEAKAVAEEKAKIAEAEKQVEVKKEAVAAKEAEVALDREGIVTDEKTTPAATEKAATIAAQPPISESVVFLVGRGSPGGGRLVVIDPVKRSTPVWSPVGGVTGADYAFFKESVVVLAREGQIVRLMLLDPKTLGVTSRGEDSMYAGSYVHAQAGAIYAVTVQGAVSRLGKYDERLVRIALSTEAVDKDTYVRIFGDEVYVSAPDGTILVLAAADLSRKGQVAGNPR